MAYLEHSLAWVDYDGLPAHILWQCSVSYMRLGIHLSHCVNIRLPSVSNCPLSFLLATSTRSPISIVIVLSVRSFVACSWAIYMASFKSSDSFSTYLPKLVTSGSAKTFPNRMSTGRRGTLPNIKLNGAYSVVSWAVQLYMNVTGVCRRLGQSSFDSGGRALVILPSVQHCHFPSDGMETYGTFAYPITVEV